VGAELSEKSIDILAPIAVWAGKGIFELTSEDINAYNKAKESSTPSQPETAFVPTVGYVNTGQTTSSSNDWQKIVSISKPTTGNLVDYQQVDVNFKAGECGVFSFNFFVFPSGAKDYITDYLDSQLRARGVSIWRPSYFDGNTLNVCFVTGLAPLIIAAIAIGVLVVLAAIIASITIYKLKRASIDAYNNQQQQLQDEFINSVNEISDPAQRAEYFSDRATGLAETTQDTGLFDFNIDFEKPVVIISILAGLALLLFVFVKFR